MALNLEQNLQTWDSEMTLSEKRMPDGLLERWAAGRPQSDYGREEPRYKSLEGHNNDGKRAREAKAASQVDAN